MLTQTKNLDDIEKKLFKECITLNACIKKKKLSVN